MKAGPKRFPHLPLFQYINFHQHALQKIIDHPFHMRPLVVGHRFLRCYRKARQWEAPWLV